MPGLVDYLRNKLGIGQPTVMQRGVVPLDYVTHAAGRTMTQEEVQRMRDARARAQAGSAVDDMQRQLWADAQARGQRTTEDVADTRGSEVNPYGRGEPRYAPESGEVQADAVRRFVEHVRGGGGGSYADFYGAAERAKSSKK